ENEGLKRIGEAMGVSEDAAQKRVTRALEKLRTILTSRGVTLSGAALAAALGDFAVTAANISGLAEKISVAAIASGAAVGGGSGIAALLSSLKFKAAMAALLGVAICAP